MGKAHLIGQVLDGKYFIEKRLGQGGMGSVYLATHVGTDRPVAVKVITPQFMNHDEFVGRFRREAKAAGRLRHPNVVDVTDFGFAEVESNRVAYLVMEYLDGCSLADVLAEEKRLPLDWVVDILDQACSAVDEAHRQGIIHRDLKPDNIWLEPNRRSGYTVKVLDFGLAKVAYSSTSDQDENAEAGDMPSSTGDSLLQMRSDIREAPSDGAIISEEATLLQSPAPAEEEKTLLLDKAMPEQEIEAQKETFSSQGTEAATLVQQPLVSEEDQTRIIDRETRRIGIEADTEPADGLTRVGSILGTPLYMSPEQCSGGTIDARSDTYSMGVIAYRMLSGETPFAGDMSEVMRHHIEEAPPPLRKKNSKVPKKVAQVVMSALAKNPDERPASAAGFASALHANSEGAGAILRKAVALFGEHAPLFLRLSLLVTLPLIVLGILRLTNSLLITFKKMPPGPGVAVTITIGLLSLVGTFLASAIISGVIVRLVTQLIVAPLRPLYLRTAFAALKKKLRPFLTLVLLVSFLIVLGLGLCIVPGFIFMLNYMLLTPVLMMEDIKGRAAMKRSKSLVRRVRRPAIIIIVIHFLIPVIMSGIIGFIIGLFTYRFGLHQNSEVTTSISELVRVGMNFFLVPLYSITTSLLYLKARQAGGETLTEALRQFEEEDTADTKWQMRMRERIQLKSGGTTSGHSRA